MLCLLTFAKKEKAPFESAAQLFSEVLTETVEKTRTVELAPALRTARFLHSVVSYVHGLRECFPTI